MLKNRYYNFDSAEGIKYIVDVSKPNGNKVKMYGVQANTPITEKIINPNPT